MSTPNVQASAPYNFYPSPEMETPGAPPPPVNPQARAVPTANHQEFFETVLPPLAQISRDFFKANAVQNGEKFSGFSSHSGRLGLGPINFSFVDNSSRWFSPTNISTNNYHSNNTRNDRDEKKSKMSNQTRFAILAAALTTIFTCLYKGADWHRQYRESCERANTVQEICSHFVTDDGAVTLNNDQMQLVRHLSAMNVIIMSSTYLKRNLALGGVAAGAVGIAAAALSSTALAWIALIGGAIVVGIGVWHVGSGENNITERCRRLFNNSMQIAEAYVGNSVYAKAEDADRAQSTANNFSTPLHSAYA